MSQFVHLKQPVEKFFLNERWLELNIGSITPTFLQEIFINYNQYTILERYLVNTKVETINIIIEVIIV
ncbi:UDP-galactopyranose mutase [Salmonella enterica]|nr:UDP-galactopyranose mutase [Salmonella enterica]